MNYQITFENGQQKGCLLLAQWDRDAQLTITGLPQTFTDIEIHWGNRLMEEFYVVEPTIRDDSVIVLIPNILLQAPENIIGYIYLDSTATCYRIDIEIQARQKPQGVPTDPTVPFYPLGTGIFDTDSEKAINAKAVLSILKGGDTGQSLKKKSDEDLDFEWSSDGTVDQHYDPESENAQSGKAVAEAVANFITNTVDNLTNYYLKSETYNRTEVNNLIGAIQTAHFEIVNVLPPIGESNVIYLILRSDPETSNKYDEYIYINSAYEKIGSTDVDLTGYATETWVNQQIANFLTQTQIQSLINTALTNYYTKTETDDLLENKAEKHFELIETMTLTAETTASTITRNIDTQGNPYNFKNIFVSFKFPSAVSTSTRISLGIYLQRKVPDMSAGGTVSGGKIFITQTYVQNGVVGAHTERKNGVLKMYMSKQGTATQNADTTPTIQNSFYLLAGDVPITSIYLQFGTDLAPVNFPVGTIINIYGVK